MHQEEEFQRRLDESETLSQQRQEHLLHQEEELGRYHDAVQRRENHIQYMMQQIDKISGFLTSLSHSRWWRMTSLIKKVFYVPIGLGKRARWSPVDKAATEVQRLKDWYEEEYDHRSQHEASLQEGIPAHSGAQGSPSFNLPQYLDDECHLLNTIDDLCSNITRMNLHWWWRLGLSARMQLTRLKLRPAPSMEYDRAAKIMDEVSQWRSDYPHRVSRLWQSDDSAGAASGEVHRLMEQIDVIDRLIQDMAGIWWWQWGLKLRRLAGTLLLKRKSFRMPNERAAETMKSYLAWKESLENLRERYTTQDAAQHFAPTNSIRPLASQLSLHSLPSSVDIVVPIHNQFDYVRRCVLSVLQHTQFAYRLILIDDCSTEPALLDFLEHVNELDFVVVHRNAKNLGFVGSANQGFRLSENDVVLLNSDVCVTPRWLRKLVTAAYSRSDVATATTLSNAATIFSVPTFGETNPIPDNQTISSMARLVEDVALREYREVPTAVGCCMYIKAQALNEVGHFDAETFGRGYGEENDFCMRALAKGWKNILDDSTFIYHKNSVSFGPEKEALIKTNLEILEARHPDYLPMVREFVDSGIIQGVLGRVEESLRRNSGEGYHPARYFARQETKRILFVMHDGGGGTSHMALDLLDNLPSIYECYYLVCDTKRLVLSRYRPGRGMQEIEAHEILSPIKVTDFTHDEYRQIVTAILTCHPFDLIHIHHLISHALDLPQIAQKLQIPYLITFHDFYLICPTVHMLNYDKTFCAGRCEASDERQCILPTPNLAQAPLLPGRWAKTWRKHIGPLLEGAAGLLAPSQPAKNVLLRQYPKLADKPFRVIEHGRDMDRYDMAVEPKPGTTVRLVTMGDISLHKGAELFRQLAEADGQQRFEIHILGPIADELRDIPGIHCHGAYERSDLPKLIESIKPSLALLLSIWPETFCYTLSEAWSFGLPVIVSDIGAPKHRVERNGGGWVVDHRNPEALYNEVIAIIEDTEAFGAKREEIRRMRFKTVAEMAEEYDAYYQELMCPHPKRFHQAARTMPAVAVVPGSRRPPYNGTDWYRLISPFRALGEAGDADVRVCDIDRVADHYPDVIAVQRTALNLEEAQALVEYCRTEGIGLIYDIDDKLLDMGDHPDADFYVPYYGAIRFLLEHADLVTVTTDDLRALYQEFNENIHVQPNFIDGSLWFTDATTLQPLPEPERSETLTFGFMGTISHIHDLDMVKKAVIRIQNKYKHVRFELVGGRIDDQRQDWYSRVAVPDECTQFERFASWFSDSCRWDFAIAPLQIDEFNQFKSHVKALEYAAKGVPAIFSDHGVYRSIITDGENGLLAENTDDGWFDAMERMILDPELRKRLRQKAFDNMKRHHLLRNNLHLWQDAIASAADPALAWKKPSERNALARSGS